MRGTVFPVRWLRVTYIASGILLSQACGGIQRLPAEEFAVLAAEGHRIGPEDAPVTIVLFTTYTCGYCSVLDSTMRIIRTKYANEVAIVIRHYGDPKSIASQFALGAECAGEQGRFEEYHQAAFANVRAIRYWNGAHLVADSAHVPDRAHFATCVEKARYENRLQRDWQAAKRLGINGTPTQFVNGFRIVGAAPLEVMEYAVKASLNDEKR